MTLTEVSLDQAIVRGEQQIASISIRRPMAGELRGLKLSDIAQLDVIALQRLIPRITTPTLTEQDVGSMDLADLAKVAVVIDGFFSPKPKPESDSPTA